MDNLFEVVSEQLDMEYFLDREGIRYKRQHGRSGMQLNVRECPVDHCHDKRSRVYLNAETGQGNCFVCNTKFSKASFIKHYIEGSWSEAARYCETLLREQGWRPKRKIVTAVDITTVKLPISEPVGHDGQNLLYLEERGIDLDCAKYFHLRYSEFGFWRYKAPEGDWKTQNFENRLIIPVFDMDGTLKTYQGRDVTGNSERKYLFPVTLPGTGRYLLNAHNFIRHEEVVMGEGFFDVAAMKLAFDGDPGTTHLLPVGSFGKHLSYGSTDCDDQLGRFIDMKRRGLKRVTIMWDGERKALISALDAAKLLTRTGLQVKIAFLPAGKDPNEVPADVVRKAWAKAVAYTPLVDARLRLKNPYK